MKALKDNRKRFSVLSLAFSLLVFLLHGCYDSDDVGDDFYTFTGETVGSFLEDRPQTYSEFTKAVEIANLSDLLKTYNKYTCFAPSNSAMLNWYQSLEVASLDAIPQEEVIYMVYSHLIPERVYNTTDFVAGAIPTTNMNSRYLVVGYRTNEGTVDVLINTNSTITESNLEVENGVIHQIDRVLTPSTSAIPTLMSEDTRISIFSEALELTGLSDSLQALRDELYVEPSEPAISIDRSTVCRWPKERKIGYTVFAETDEILANYGITDIESLKAYAAQIYDGVYPQDAGISDVTNRRNSLNRFIAYHIIDKTVHYNNFFYVANMSPGALHTEFMETFCPNTIFKVTNEDGGAVINSDHPRNVRGVKILPIEAGREQDTENGIYHLIDDILVYDQKVITMLLNTRIRMDAASLHPELMTNGIRYEKGDDPAGITGADKYYKFPNGYLKNVEFFSNNTDLYYLQGNRSTSSDWNNYQADEMMAQGEFDFTMRMLPVPAGTYEVRFGYTANGKRGILQFYVDGIPQGIPLNMKIGATDPAIGWVADAATQDNGIENDKMMRNRGYMKGGESYMGGEATARQRSHAMRRIVSTETWSEDGAHYLRFKNVSSDVADQFMIDFFELVPKNVYENPNGIAEDRL